MKRHAPFKNGFTLVEIMIVVAVVGLLGAIAVPNLVQARKTSQTNACINNLREIDGAKQQWALETGKNSSDTPQSTDIQTYLGRGAQGSLTSVCCPLIAPPTPMGGYTVNTVGTPPVCNQYDTNQHPAVLY
jgi:prepilin-type N-terminal cleavage/methylation domain-containing protein